TTETEQIELNKELVYDFEAIDRLVKFLGAQEAGWHDYFEPHGIEPLHLIYEDLAHSWEQTAIQVLDFLEIAHPSPLVIGEKTLLRQADALTEQWVQLYHEHKQTMLAQQ